MTAHDAIPVTATADGQQEPLPLPEPVPLSGCPYKTDPYPLYTQMRGAGPVPFDRSPNPHLAFGHGIHFCPGAAPARAELRVTLGTLLRRLPGLRLAVPDDALDWIPAVLARGVNQLPVAYDRRA